MLPDIGGSELLIIAVVALIVVGPKDLPVLLRRLGQFMAKLRGMASEFRASFDEMARQSELDELRKEVEAMRRGQLTDFAADATGMSISQEASDIEASLSDMGVSFQPPMGEAHAEFQAREAAGAAAAPKAAKPKARKAPAKKKTTAAKAKPKTAAVVEGGRKPRKIVEGGRKPKKIVEGGS